MKNHRFSKVRFAALTLICVSAACAQTCTPFNAPAVIVQGQTFRPAVVNGIDDVSYSTVRFQWTSDATANPINLSRIVYATAAQWAANPGVYPETFLTVYTNVTNSSTLQGNVVSNLMANTTYHMAGQSSTNNGSTWCPAVDETFTTLRFTGVPKPTPPKTFSLTEPTITGTDYTVGVSPCTTFAACVALANPGDGIGIPPGAPVVLPSGGGGFAFSSFKVPASSITVTPTAATSSFSASSVAGLTNGELVHFGSNYYIPSPLNAGVTYSLVNVNSAANTFQVSQDGTNPLTLNDIGVGTIYVIPWPISQSYVVIHSTASASSLPPAGVRLDPVAYGPNLGVIQMSAPGLALFNMQYTAYYWFRDIELNIAANAPDWETDPTPSGYFFQTSALSDHIVFDQCWLHAPPAPDRIDGAASWGGTNQAIINSYMDNIDFWRPTRTGTGSSVGANSVTVPAHTYNWVGPGNTKRTCTLASPATISFSGTSSTDFYLYWTINPCVLTANVQTGLTATGSAFNIVTSTSPGFPVDLAANYTELQIGAGEFLGTSVSYSDYGISGISRFSSESASGLGLDAGPGPFMFINNSFTGEGIIGVYLDEYNGNGCVGATQCPYIYNTIDLTAQRNTIQSDPKYFNSGFSASPLWNGSYWYGRNAFELKQGSRALYDGNIVGPVHGGLSNGECWDLFTYFGSNPQNQVNTQRTGDIQISNNTCANSGSTVTMEGESFLQTTPGNTQQKIWVHNNLFLNNNGYLATGTPDENIAQGRGIRTFDTESVTIDHNTFFRQGGSGSSSVGVEVAPSGGFDVENNIFSYSTESDTPGFAFDNAGGSTSTPAPPQGAQGTALLPFLYNTTFKNNVFLGTWSNGYPPTLTEMTSAQIASAAALYPATTYFPQGNTMSDRVSQMSWFSPSTSNFRLATSASAYCSGCGSPGSDGLDIGADIDALESAQGKVSNVHPYAVTPTTAAIGFLAPDSMGCSVDWGTSNFVTGSGTWTRVANSGGARVQSVALSALPAATAITYRVNCAVMQPTGTFTTP